ncbi:MAG TPA: hypothetical protein VN840_09120 [Streptosporangiaceae bacterium]|nr:hypothetical protein [Streptosporangiaceae bacterium]
MRASLLARAGSVAAAAVIAVTGAVATAGAADAAAHVRRLPTHLSIAKVPAILHHRHVAVIVGDLRSHRVPLAGKIVFLDRKTPGGPWVVVRKEVTRRHGEVAFVVSPKLNARYVLVFKGTLNFSPTRSRVVVVRARA